MSQPRPGVVRRLFDHLPELADMDRTIYHTIAFGFPLLTMVIITGAVWAQYVWQKWWSWDPKETASLVTWLVYAAYLHGRRQRNWRGSTSANFAMAGFVAVLFTYAGVNFLNSMHSYGAPTSSVHGGFLSGFAGVGMAEVVLTTGFYLTYLVAFLVAVGGAVWDSRSLTRAAFFVALVGVVANTAVLVIRVADAGRLTFTSGYDFSLWFAWGIALCGLVATVRGQKFALLACLPLALLVAMYGYLYFPDKGNEPLQPALKNKLWLHIHVSLAIIAYGTLALAAGWGVLYWLKALVTRSRPSAGPDEAAPDQGG